MSKKIEIDAYLLQRLVLAFDRQYQPSSYQKADNKLIICVGEIKQVLKENNAAISPTKYIS